MSNLKKYNLFLLISTFARNIVEVFSSVILYEKGYSIKDILLFYAILYSFGIIVNLVSIWLGKIIRQKNILILSSLIYGYCFYFLSKMDTSFSSLILFSILLSIGSYTYHSMRHYFALSILPDDNKKEVGSILIVSYVAVILSSYLGGYITDHLGLFWIVIIVVVSSLVSIIPIMKLDLKKKEEKISFDFKKIGKHKIFFFVTEQFKVIFLSIQPLFLYIYAKTNIEYIGIFNALLGVASVIFIYFVSRKLNLEKYFWILNIIFCLILVLKINIFDKWWLLLIAFFEGLGTKMYEIASTTNVYHKDYRELNGYLMLVEFIFCGMRGLICFLFYFFVGDIRLMLYICIVGILISGFIRYPHFIKKKSLSLN